MPTLRKHQLEIHHNTGATPKSTFLNCDKCNYKTKTENNLEVHRSLKHRQIISCNLCVFECGTQSELLVHEEEAHKKNKFSCKECHNIFHSAKKLQEHMQYKHSEISCYPCDHCGKRYSNFNDLDDHIENQYSSAKHSNSRKIIDIQNVNNKKPCNPSDPSHTSRCCDRKPRQEAEIPLLKKEMVPADSGTMMVTVLMGNHANIHMCKSVISRILSLWVVYVQILPLQKY